jgi:hypothetical protein
LYIGTTFALTEAKKRTTPPVSAFELAATRFQALAAFFSSAAGGAGDKPLIRKEMLENKAFAAISR